VTRLLIASNSPVSRAGLEAVISSDPSLTLSGRSLTLRELSSDFTEEISADVLVVQLDRQESGFVDELRRLRRGPHESPRPAVVILAHADVPAGLAEVLRLGVGAVLPHEATASEIIAAIQASAAGLVAIHPLFIDLLPDVPAAPPAARAPKPALTPREIEVLNLMAQGLGNKEIAWRLGISEHTVKFHIGSIFNKLDASGRTEAVTLGIRAGLVML
jgi:two-component system, NarL family, response regulator YdfI